MFPTFTFLTIEGSPCSQQSRDHHIPNNRRIFTFRTIKGPSHSEQSRDLEVPNNRRTFVFRTIEGPSRSEQPRDLLPNNQGSSRSHQSISKSVLTQFRPLPLRGGSTTRGTSHFPPPDKYFIKLDPPCAFFRPSDLVLCSDFF